MDRIEENDSPQLRRRRSLVAKQVFTVSMAGVEVQRRFIARQRLLFVLQVLAGIATMFLAALVLDSPEPDLLWPLAGGAAFLFFSSAMARKRRHWIQPLTFALGLMTTAGAIGCSIPTGPSQIYVLLNPTCLIGGVLIGSAINGLLVKRDLTPWTEFLLTGPWLVLSCVLVTFFPAGESVLAISGLVALLLAFCMHRASPESLRLYQPSEVLVASADVVPLACIATFRWLSGRS